MPLLETYLDRREPDWRAHVAGQGADGAGPQAGAGGAHGRGDRLLHSRLAPGASADEIKAAHRRLMTKLHPDHGGSSYLAAQLNQAKDYPAPALASSGAAVGSRGRDPSRLRARRRRGRTRALFHLSG